MSAEILAVGMATSAGLDAESTAAAVRARLNRFRQSAILDARLHPLVLAAVPLDEIPELAPSLATEGFTTRRERVVALAALALGEVLRDVPAVERIPVLLGLPDAHPGFDRPFDEELLEQLSAQSEIAFARRASRVFPSGRASGLLALDEALSRSAAEYIVVGGADSPFDLRLLAELDHERRLRAPGAFDGFIPGEGAAFLLLGKPGSGAKIDRPPLARIAGVAVGEEPGHRYSQVPYRGDGLASVLSALFAAVPGEQVQTVYAGFNGEVFNAKEWAVGHIRNHDRFAKKLAMHHPADCLGDLGAALAPAMIGLAAIGLRDGYRRGPCLVWGSSDLAPRGAALIA